MPNKRKSVGNSPSKKTSSQDGQKSIASYFSPKAAAHSVLPSSSHHPLKKMQIDKVIVIDDDDEGERASEACYTAHQSTPRHSSLGGEINEEDGRLSQESSRGTSADSKGPTLVPLPTLGRKESIVEHHDGLLEDAAPSNHGRLRKSQALTQVLVRATIRLNRPPQAEGGAGTGGGDPSSIESAQIRV